MAYFLSITTTVLLLYISQYVYNLIRNIINARAIGLPMVLVPVDQTSLLWSIYSPFCRDYLERLLPTQSWQRLAITIFGWEFHEKTQPFDQFAACHGNGIGRSYLLVGLGKLELWTADPEATQEILLRVRDFHVPEAMEWPLGQFGPNVLNTNGDKWARHRRIVTAVIDERISKTVFEESIRQAHGLLDELSSSSRGKPDSMESPRLFDMLKNITIHVLIGASMGTGVPWAEETQRPELDFKMTYKESLAMVVTNLVGAVMIPTSILTRWPSWLPGYQKMSIIGCAKVEIQKRSKMILDQERNRMASGQRSTRNNIMSKLLQASGDGSGSGQVLSEAEMIGNLFILTAAGFETTATTLAYAMVLLARYPQWQDWLLEEVERLLPFPNNDDDLGEARATMEYTTIFPQAMRILAFMLETLRLYSPVPHVHRETTSLQTLHTATGPVRIPAGTRVYINTIALHLLPAWRDINHASDPAFFAADKEVKDEYAFRPSRWLKSLGPSTSGSGAALFHPPKGMFVPWALGPRVCPGQKMAQIEFTAVMLTLLRRHRVEAVPLKDEEGWPEIGARLDARLRDSRWVTVLQMNGVFEPREDKGEGLWMRLSTWR